jgi:Na+-translocating ferredoxin:NAD+ oxidoreductase subunit E
MDARAAMTRESTLSSVGSAEPGPLLNGIWKQNPVLVQVLGMCPVLAVSNTAVNALAMGLATSSVLILSSATVSLLRHWVPPQARIVTFIMVIAAFVTCVDYLVQTISIELHRALGAFLSLIVVNCLVLGRAEAFASQQPLGRSLADAVGMGIGFLLALLCLGTVRELVGSGQLFGNRVLAESYQGWAIMLLPPGGFFALAGWLVLFRWWGLRRAGAQVQRVLPQESH